MRARSESKGFRCFGMHFLSGEDRTVAAQVSFNVRIHWSVQAGSCILTCPFFANRFGSAVGALPTTYMSIRVFPKIRGTPKSPILLGFSIINHPFSGTPIFWKHPLIRFHFFPLLQHAWGWQTPKVWQSWSMNRTSHGPPTRSASQTSQEKLGGSFYSWWRMRQPKKQSFQGHFMVFLFYNSWDVEYWIPCLIHVWFMFVFYLWIWGTWVAFARSSMKTGRFPRTG